MTGIWAGSDLAGAIVSSLGFAGAVIAYVLNRNKDRKLQLQSEKRAVYREFFEVTGCYFAALQGLYYSKDSDSELLKYGRGEYEKVRKAQDSLAYYAPAEVLQCCYAYVDSLVIYRGHLNRDLNGRKLSPKAAMVSGTIPAFKHLQDARHKAIIHARADTNGKTVKETAKELVGVFNMESEAPSGRIEPVLKAPKKSAASAKN